MINILAGLLIGIFIYIFIPGRKEFIRWLAIRNETDEKIKDILMKDINKNL